MIKNKTSEQPFNIYGVRKTKNKNYFSVVLIKDNGVDRQWLNVPVRAEKVHIEGESAFVHMKLLEEKAGKPGVAKPRPELPF